MANHAKSLSQFQLTLESRAAAFRGNLTTSESRLWSELSASKLGVVFRRQVPLGRYIADFLAPSVKLIIEVDGGYHSRRVAADARRDRHLSRLGFHVLHLDSELVLRDLPQAVARVRNAIANSSSAP
jgi:very-short-patch-repair endonuclease